MHRAIAIVRQLGVILALTGAMAIPSTPIRCDGVYIPKLAPGGAAQDLTEPTQKALVVHYKGTENLILQVSYKGSVSDFAWLVPTPSVPQLEQGPDWVFRSLHAQTGARIRYWFDADMIVHSSQMTFGRSGSKLAEPAEVEVLGRKLVGGYDAAVLRARSDAGLLEWLHSNGYHVPGRMRPVLADYIRRGWIFTAARISDSHGPGRMKEGTLEPLQLRFATSQPVYPLKVSSLNPGRTNVLVYVMTDHFVSGRPLRTICAVSDQGAVRLWRNLLHEWAEETPRKVRITKLRAELRPEQMSHDLVLAFAESQAVIPPPSVSPPFFENLGALVLALVALVFSLPICLMTSVACLAMFVMRFSKNDRLPWLLSSLVMLVIWLPVMMLVIAIEGIGYWPVGVALCGGLALCVLLRLRRVAARRKKLVV